MKLYRKTPRSRDTLKNVLPGRVRPCYNGPSDAESSRLPVRRSFTGVVGSVDTTRQTGPHQPGQGASLTRLRGVDS